MQGEAFGVAAATGRRQAPVRGLAALAGLALLPWCGAGAATLPPGCAAERPAVAYHADGSVQHPAGPAPLVCVVRTGFGGAETHLRVARNGTLIEEPAVLTPGLLGTGFLAGLPGPRPQTQLSPAGLALSADAGADWSFVEPGGGTWVAEDASLYVDRVSGRLFYYGLTENPAPQGGAVPVAGQVPGIYAHLLSSADLGASWSAVSLVGYTDSENPRFASAPAPAGQPAAAPGENVAYWCGNNMQFTEVARLCYRSLDGGATWKQRSILFSRGLPRHPECGLHGEDIGALDGNYPQGAADGSLWVLVACGGKTFLARSTDEGATWPILRRSGGSEPLSIPAAEELRIDPQGNLYAVHLQGAALQLRVSRDGGQSWAGPFDLTLPAARGASILQWAMAARGPGVVAVSYLSARSGGGYDGIVVVTRNALGPQPLFWGAAVNAPDAALVTRPASAIDDFIDLDLGPDGTPWAAFYADCPADGGDPTCAQAQGAPDPLGKATAVARLYWR